MLTREQVEERLEWYEAHPPDNPQTIYKAVCVAERQALETARQLAEWLDVYVACLDTELLELRALARGLAEARAVALVTRGHESWCRFCGERVNTATDWGHKTDCFWLRSQKYAEGAA